MEEEDDHVEMGMLSAMCEECERIVADQFCKDCELYYCKQCDVHRHRKGTLRLHTRNGIEHLSYWTIHRIQNWLCSIRMDQYLDMFKMVDGKVLESIDNEDAVETVLGIENRLHRKKLYRELCKLKLNQEKSLELKGRFIAKYLVSLNGRDRAAKEFADDTMWGGYCG